MSRSLSPPANTLLEGSDPGDDPKPEVYDVLSRPDETNLLVLSYSLGPDAWLQHWRTRVGDLPSELGFVHVGVKTRSAAARFGDVISDPNAPDSAPEPFPSGDPFLTDAVSDPADLARIGICASEYLEAWDGNGQETVVFLDSLTELLENVSLAHAFKFLHILGTRIKGVGGRGYYLVDPSAHDDHSLAVVRELVDSVVDLDA